MIIIIYFIEDFERIISKNTSNWNISFCVYVFCSSRWQSHPKPPRPIPIVEIVNSTHWLTDNLVCEKKTQENTATSKILSDLFILNVQRIEKGNVNNQTERKENSIAKYIVWISAIIMSSFKSYTFSCIITKEINLKSFQ